MPAIAAQPLPPMPRARKPRPPQACACGCGGQTRGGRFLPGHDARLAGWAVRLRRGLITPDAILHDGERAAAMAAAGMPAAEEAAA